MAQMIPSNSMAISLCDSKQTCVPCGLREPARCLCFYLTKERKRVSLDVQTLAQIPFKKHCTVLFLLNTLLWHVTRVCGVPRQHKKS